MEGLLNHPWWMYLLAVAVYFFGTGVVMALLEEYRLGWFVLLWPLILLLALISAPVWAPLVAGAALVEWWQRRRRKEA